MSVMCLFQVQPKNPSDSFSVSRILFAGYLRVFANKVKLTITEIVIPVIPQMVCHGHAPCPDSIVWFTRRPVRVIYRTLTGHPHPFALFNSVCPSNPKMLCDLENIFFSANFIIQRERKCVRVFFKLSIDCIPGTIYDLCTSLLYLMFTIVWILIDCLDRVLRRIANISAE